MKAVRNWQEGFRWDETELLAYKSDAAHFENITRQLLFNAPHGLSTQLRYFEISPGGFSTLEKHAHPHAVVVLRGTGRVLINSEIHDLAPFDLVTVAPWAWHQFRAEDTSTFGFLCLVNIQRDQPVLPSEDDLAKLRRNSLTSSFIKL